MTTTQRNSLASALLRAWHDRIRIVFDGPGVWATTSASDPSTTHLVVQVGRRLVCDCPSRRAGVVCKHRACVHAHLATEAAQGREVA